MARQKQTNKSLATLDGTHESNPAGFVTEGIYIHLLSIRFVWLVQHSRMDAKTISDLSLKILTVSTFCWNISSWNPTVNCCTMRKPKQSCGEARMENLLHRAPKVPSHGPSGVCSRPSATCQLSKWAMLEVDSAPVKLPPTDAMVDKTCHSNKAPPANCRLRSRKKNDYYCDLHPTTSSHPSRSWKSTELSSLLPYRASHQQTILHMVVYICQCCPLNLSHPILPPLCP